MKQDSTLDSDLVSLIARGDELRVVFRARKRKRRTIDLQMIQRKPGSQKGSGAKIMRLLCGVADKHRAVIETYVLGADPTLSAYYADFGFEENPAGSDEAMMRRLPRPDLNPTS
jgi:hypothetical protein